MLVRDLERLVITREPVLIDGVVHRIISVLIVWTPQGIDHYVDAISREGKRCRVFLDQVTYLNGRKSV